MSLHVFLVCGLAFGFVQLIGGKQLLNVIVDTDEVADKCIMHLMKRGIGRLTFVPLNRIAVKSISYPTSSDCVPLIHQLKYHRKFLPAVQQVRAGCVS